jgi:hypothetical protein
MCIRLNLKFVNREGWKVEELAFKIISSVDDKTHDSQMQGIQ